jgi:hypothetical protein
VVAHSVQGFGMFGLVVMVCLVDFAGGSKLAYER